MGRPGKRPANPTEPQPRLSTPQCPKYLDARAKQEWKRLAPVLRRMKVLSEADGLALGNLCIAVSTLAKAQAHIAKSGILYKSPSGFVMQSPVLPIVNAQIDIITRLCKEFGLSPAARARLSAMASDDGPVLDAVERSFIDHPRLVHFPPDDPA